MLDAARPHLLRIQGPNCLGLMLPPLGLDASFCHRHPLARRPRLRLAIGRADHRRSSTGRRARHRLLARRLARRHGRRRFRRPARLPRRRRREPRHPALHRAADARAEVHVGGATRRARQAGDRDQVRPPCGRRARRRCRTPARSPAPTPPTRPPSAAPACCGCSESARTCSTPPRCCRGMPRLDGERLMILTNGGGAGVLAADRLADLGGRLAELSPTTDRARSTRCCRDLVARPIRSTSSAMPTPQRYAAALDILLDKRRRRRDPGDELPDRARLERPRSPRRSSTSRSARKQRGAAAKPMLTNWLGDERRREARELFACERDRHVRHAGRARSRASCNWCATPGHRTS